MLKAVRIGSVIAGCVCLVLFFSFSAGSRLDGAAGWTRSESWLTIGSPWPWYESRVVTEQGEDCAVTHGDAGPRLTPAWVLPPLALVLFRLARRLKRAEAKRDDDQAGPPAADVRQPG